MKKFLLLCLLLGLTSGCTMLRHIQVDTATTIGFTGAVNPQENTYQFQGGYNRSEHVTGAAADTPVLMEIRYGSLWKSNGGIYQRLAIGTDAISQPGAALMFAKSNDGSIDTATATAIVQNIKKVDADDPTANTALLSVAKLYAQAADKKLWDQAAVKAGFSSFSDFLVKPHTVTVTNKVITELRNSKLIP